MVDTSLQRGQGSKRKGSQKIQKMYQRHKSRSLQKSKNTLHEAFETERTKQWEAFASKFNGFTPIAEIWQLTKLFNLKRRPPWSFPALNFNGQEITDPKLMMNTFVRYYSSVSSNDSYHCSRAAKIENKCNFDSDNSEQTWVGTAQNSFDSNQLSLRKFWFNSTHDSQRL